MLSIPEYYEKNGNITLILRNKISEHSKTIHHTVIDKIEKNWKNYNETQKKIFQYLFVNHQGTIDGLVNFTQINRNTIRSYLNKLIDDEIVIRLTEKQRDLHAQYVFKKL